MAIDKKTDPTSRIATLIALGVMVLTVIICLFLALTDESVPFDESVLIVGAPVETKKASSGSIFMLVLSVILIIALYIVITFLALKEQKKNMPKKKAETETRFEF